MLRYWLRDQRKRLNLTQGELAARAGVAQEYISQIETGKRQNIGGDVMIGLAKALDMSVDDLIQAAGLRPSSEADELRDLLNRGRALGWSAALIAAIERQAERGQMPEQERQALLRDLRTDIEEAERRSTARAPGRPAPPEAQAQTRQATGGGILPTYEAHPAPTQPSRQAEALSVHEAVGGYSC